LRAGDGEKRRRPGDVLEEGWVVGLAGGDEARAIAFEPGDLVFSLGDAGDADALARALHQLGQGGERRFSRALAVDELAKGLRADIFGADEAQPVDPLRRREQDRAAAHVQPAFFSAPILGSVPAIRRWMFCQCL
jgi:hypothetical protein